MSLREIDVALDLALRKAAFDESKHPRDRIGRFADNIPTLIQAAPGLGSYRSGLASGTVFGTPISNRRAREAGEKHAADRIAAGVSNIALRDMFDYYTDWAANTNDHHEKIAGAAARAVVIREMQRRKLVFEPGTRAPRILKATDPSGSGIKRKTEKPAYDLMFEEDKHPRDAGGKFAPKGSSGNSKKDSKRAVKDEKKLLAEHMAENEDAAKGTPTSKLKPQERPQAILKNGIDLGQPGDPFTTVKDFSLFLRDQGSNWNEFKKAQPLMAEALQAKEWNDTDPGVRVKKMQPPKLTSSRWVRDANGNYHLKPPPVKKGVRATAFDLLLDLRKRFDPQQPRNKQGEWTDDISAVPDLHQALSMMIGRMQHPLQQDEHGVRQRMNQRAKVRAPRKRKKPLEPEDIGLVRSHPPRA